MTEPAPDPQPDPERGWPPRFTNEFVGWTALLLVLVFVSVAGWFRSVFDGAGLLDSGDDAAENVAAYVLFIVGLLSILAGILFALIEARKPPPPSEGLVGLGADPVNMVGKVIEFFHEKKASTVLFSIGVVLLFLAAAGTGLIEINVGEDAGGSNANNAEAIATP